SCRCMVNVFATSLSSSATAMADLGRQDRRNQQLGVRLAWVVEDLVGQTTLDDLAVLHDHDPVRQQPCDTKIVGHDHDCKLEIGNKATDEIEQACLHRDVEPAGRLVH